jgi:2-oxoacid:acceptor oxidoreductase gamma subunit (pyruvate/2-ketoisovalerate family)
MRELRIHGRGGQGAVIASKVLAVALFREGREVQSFPAFGVERRGAPVTAFLRVADHPIRLRCEITEPDDLIVLDATLIGATEVAAGLKPGGLIVVNTERAPEELSTLIGRFRVATVDASGIATARGIGSRSQPIVNTAILGAWAAAAGFPGMDALCEAIREEVPTRPEENVAAAQDAAASVRIAAPPGSSPSPRPSPSPSVPQEPAHA